MLIAQETRVVANDDPSFHCYEPLINRFWGAESRLRQNWTIKWSPALSETSEQLPQNQNNTQPPLELELYKSNLAKWNLSHYFRSAALLLDCHWWFCHVTFLLQESIDSLLYIICKCLYNVINDMISHDLTKKLSFWPEQLLIGGSQTAPGLRQATNSESDELQTTASDWSPKPKSPQSTATEPSRGAATLLVAYPVGVTWRSTLIDDRPKTRWNSIGKEYPKESVCNFLQYTVMLVIPSPQLLVPRHSTCCEEWLSPGREWCLGPCAGDGGSVMGLMGSTNDHTPTICGAPVSSCSCMFLLLYIWSFWGQFGTCRFSQPAMSKRDNSKIAGALMPQWIHGDCGWNFATQRNAQDRSAYRDLASHPGLFHAISHVYIV